MKKTCGLEKQALDKIETIKKLTIEYNNRLQKLRFENTDDFNEWKKEFSILIDGIKIDLDWLLNTFEKELICLPTM